MDGGQLGGKGSERPSGRGSARAVGVPCVWVRVSLQLWCAGQDTGSEAAAQPESTAGALRYLTRNLEHSSGATVHQARCT